MADVAALGCETLIAELNNLNTRLNKLIKAPKALLQVMRRFADYPFQRASELLDEYLGIADKLNFNLTPKDFISSLEHLLDCPFIADTDLGRQAAEAIDMFNEGGGIPKKIIDTIQNTIKKQFEDAAGEYAGIADNSLDALGKQYDDLLKDSGIKDGLRALRNLEQCIADGCATYESAMSYLPGGSNDLLESLHCKIDEAGNIVSDIYGSTTGIPNKALEESKQLSEKFTALKNKSISIVTGI